MRSIQARQEAVLDQALAGLHWREAVKVMARASDELLSTLFECHGGALRRYTHSLTRNAALTEDIVQETMLRAWQRPKVLELDKDAAQAWLFTVARRLVIDDARSARSRREVAAPGEGEGAALDRTDAVLDSIMVADALASLSDQHRQVVVCAYFAGQSIPEISRRLGIPEGTAKSRLHYGLRGLRLALQERGVTR